MDFETRVMNRVMWEDVDMVGDGGNVVGGIVLE